MTLDAAGSTTTKSNIDAFSVSSVSSRKDRTALLKLAATGQKSDLKYGAKDSRRPSMSSKQTFLNNKYVLVNKGMKPGKANKNVFKLEFKSKMDGMEIRAKLLETPCLTASYMIKNVEINTIMTEDASKVAFFLDTHFLSFECDDELLSELARKQSAKRRGMEKNMSYKDVTGNKSMPRKADSFQGALHMNPLDERTNFFLPSISLIANYTSSQVQLTDESVQLESQSNKQALENKKTLKSFNYLDLDFKVAPLSNELNAEVIAQLFFVTKVFIKEMNNILQAVYTSNESVADKQPTFSSRQSSDLNKQKAANQYQSTHFYYILKVIKTFF